ncbi:MAG: type II toxin-antitoxin system death-on-curing family toxin [Defluviitaleaceae bacterium]|nr:type II toxin-antitoxin system death-on-curing family toxin [Defluviitaleaceae bacterium]
MKILTTLEVITLHEMLITSTGGSPGVRDYGLLESAIMGCYQSFSGIYLYPSIVEKAARIAYTISKNHPFIDGNKRVSVIAMLSILRMNGIAFSFTQQELIELGLGIADGSIGYDEILRWVHAHLIT